MVDSLPLVCVAAYLGQVLVVSDPEIIPKAVGPAVYFISYRYAACFLPSTALLPSENSRNFPGSPHVNAANPKHAEKSTSASVGGPLPCLTFEILRCTTLEEMETLVARTLKVDSNEIRLWVITQPFTDSPLAPRQLLRCGRFNLLGFRWFMRMTTCVSARVRREQCCIEPSWRK